MAAAIRRIFSAYRKDDYADAKGFTAQLGVILESYPPTVVDYISSPHTGIQRRSKWPPSIAEIVEACNDRLGYEVGIARLRAVKITEKKRRETYVPPTPEEDAKIKKGFDELLAKFKETNVVGKRK